MQEAGLDMKCFLDWPYRSVPEEMSTNNPWQDTTIYTECPGYVFSF